MVGEFAGSEKNRLPQTGVLEVDADIRERGTPDLEAKQRRLSAL